MSHNLSAHASLNDLLKASSSAGAGAGSSPTHRESSLLTSSSSSPLKQQNQQQNLNQQEEEFKYKNGVRNSIKNPIKSKDLPPQVIVTIQTNQISDIPHHNTIHNNNNNNNMTNINQNNVWNPNQNDVNLKEEEDNNNVNTIPNHPFEDPSLLQNTTVTHTVPHPFLTTSHPLRIHQTQSFPTQNDNTYAQQPLYQPYAKQIIMEQGDTNMVHRPGSSPSTYSRPQQAFSYDAIDPKKNARHTKSLTLDTASLAQIAAELSTLKPMSDPNRIMKQPSYHGHDPQYDHLVDDIDNDLHLVTLGDDPKDCATTSATATTRTASLATATTKKRHHRRFLSFQGTTTTSSSSTTTNTTTTPTNMTTTTNLMPRPNSGGSLPRMTTWTPSPSSSSLLPTLTIGTTESNHERIRSTEIKIRSSEQDPTPHQTSIPTLSETLFQAKLCELMDNYRKIDQNFDFSCLIHMSTAQIMECVHQFQSRGSLRSSRTSHNANLYLDVNNKRGSMDTLEGFHRVSSVEKMDAMGHNVHSRRGSMESATRAASSPRLGPGDNASPNALGAENTGTSFHFINSELFNCNQQQLMMEHEPILSSILEGGDLVVEGFYHEGVTQTASDTKSKPFDTSTEKSTQDRMEVAIFKSDTKRQIIVVYQDSVENQSNPVKKREQKDGVQRRFHIGSGKDDDNRFSEEQPFPVFPPFRKAYFENGDIESQVFETLDKLAEQNPFYDIIMTGHSMGGVLSLLASMRYADAKPALMVSCFAFGCPKIGSLEFRFYINSLPNLKVMRFEYGYDPWTYCPEHPMWVHAGHTITITKRESKPDACGPSHHVLRRALSDGVTHASSSIDLLVKAFKFGAVRPDSSGSTKGAGGGGGIGKILNRHRERNMDHEISSYVHALERIQTFDDNSNNQVFWPMGFVGEDGSGVEGLDHEKRLVC